MNVQKALVCQVRSHGSFIAEVGVENGVGCGRGTTCLKFGEDRGPVYLFKLHLGSTEKDLGTQNVTLGAHLIMN